MELAVVVAKAVEATAPLLEQRRHRLNLSVPSQGLSVDADEVRLTQVIGHLLTNAALYTDPDGRIDVAGVERARRWSCGFATTAPGSPRPSCRGCSRCSCRTRAAPTAPKVGSGWGSPWCGR